MENAEVIVLSAQTTEIVFRGNQGLRKAFQKFPDGVFLHHLVGSGVWHDFEPRDIFAYRAPRGDVLSRFACQPVPGGIRLLAVFSYTKRQLFLIEPKEKFHPFTNDKIAIAIGARGALV